MALQVSRTLSNRGFVVTMINTCIGLGLLAKPYALYTAGWYSIISIVMAFTFISYASFLIAKSVLVVYKIPADDHERITAELGPRSEIVPLEQEESDTEFVEQRLEEREEAEGTQASNKSVFEVLGETAFGAFGRYYVTTITVIFLFVMCVSVFIIQSNLCADIVAISISINSPSSTDQKLPLYLGSDFMFLYILIATAPLIFFTKWKQMTIAGTISVISITILVCSVFYVFVYAQHEFPSGYVANHYFSDEHGNAHQRSNTAGYAREQMTGFERVLFSFVVFQIGIGGVTSIPPMVIALRDKSLSNIFRLTVISYAIVLLFSVSFGSLGALTYRGNVDVLILNSMAIWPGNYIVVFVSAIKITNLWSSFAIFFFCLCDVLEGVLSAKHSTQKFALRVAVMLAALLVAFLCRFELAVVTATTSSIGTLGSGLLMPLLVFLGLFYSTMTNASKILHVALIVFALFTAALVVYAAISGLAV